MDTLADSADNIKACRTCGIHFVAPSKHQLKHLFQSCQEHAEVMLIRLELAQWKVEISENDGFPQYVCNSCIHKFQQVFQLREACINAQNELRKFYAIPNGSATNIKIKSEKPDRDEESATCDFIYVDELSDEEYDGATPFNIPHIPIKEEVIEAATVPMEDLKQPLNAVECAFGVMPTDPSYSHNTNLVTRRDSVTVSQTDANSAILSGAFKCDLCQQISTNQENLKHHMQVVHDVKDLECHVCGKEFKNSTSARLKFHMKWHTLNKEAKCSICGFVCHSKESLSAHKRTNHRKINCKICGRRVLAKKMKSHLHQHELEQNYPCEYCAKVFSAENEREDHIWQTHAREDNFATSSTINYQTSYTPQVNGHNFNLTQVENVCEEPQRNLLFKYICAHCEHRFMNQLDLEIHVKEEHCVIHLTTCEPKTMIIEKTSDTVQIEQNHAILEKYGKVDEMQVTNINDSSISIQDIIHDPISASVANQKMQEDETKHGEIACDDDIETSEYENQTVNLTTCADGDLNTFACAKCSETFATIEQLCEHHKQHLLEQQKPKVSLTKSKFHCNLCGKLFDLKFRLNRHIKKHAHFK